MVKCIKLNEELEGFDVAPAKGELGERIKQNVSKKAWGMWVEHSKMIVNEFRLSMASPEARVLMRSEMEKYFFGTGATAPPPDFVPKATP